MTALEFNIQRLRERRTLLMGVASLMVYFAHVYSYADPSVLGTLFTFGNWDVDLFLLMSGFGMCYSMAKRPIAHNFYWKRFLRVGVPCLVLAVPFCLLSDVLVANRGDRGLFALDVFTLSYWLLHRGAWYVAMLVPLYLLVPLVGWSCRRYGTPVICVATAVLVAAIALCLKAAFVDTGFALNVANVAQRIPSFFVGYLLADYLITGKSRGGIRQGRYDCERSHLALLVPHQEHGVHVLTACSRYCFLGVRSTRASFRAFSRKAWPSQPRVLSAEHLRPGLYARRIRLGGNRGLPRYHCDIDSRCIACAPCTPEAT